jgi:DNA end-binding protein Ku
MKQSAGNHCHTTEEHKMASVVWKGFLSFGLVSFPVRLQAAARNKPLRFNMLHQKDLSRIKEVFFCIQENQALQRTDIVKGFEVAKRGLRRGDG